MARVLAPILWIYDFLVEDVALLIGGIIAVAVAILMVRLAPDASGYVFFAAVMLAISASIWRTVQASASS